MSIAARTTAMKPTPDPAAVPAVWTRLFSHRVARSPERRRMSPMTKKPRNALTTEMFGPYPMRSVTIGSAAPIKAATTQATSTARSVISRRASALLTGLRSRSGWTGCALDTSCGSTARGVPPFTSRMNAETTLLSLADEERAADRGSAPLWESTQMRLRCGVQILLRRGRLEGVLDGEGLAGGGRHLRGGGG